MPRLQRDLLAVDAQDAAAGYHRVDLFLAVRGMVVLGSFLVGRQLELIELEPGHTESGGQRPHIGGIVRFLRLLSAPPGSSADATVSDPRSNRLRKRKP